MTPETEKLIASVISRVADGYAVPQDEIAGLIQAVRDADMAQAMLREAAQDHLTALSAYFRNMGSETIGGELALASLAAEERLKDRLAPDAGVKALAELRADRDRLAADNANLQARIEALNTALHDAYAHQISACAEWEAEMAKARGAQKHKVVAARYAGHYSAASDLSKRITALAEDDMLVSALATREAWKGILPGGEG